MKRTIENIKDPLFRFFEREVNAGIQLLADVRRDMKQATQICMGERKATNYHRTLISELAKGDFKTLMTFCLKLLHDLDLLLLSFQHEDALRDP